MSPSSTRTRHPRTNRALVVGFGSIGQRHVEVLDAIGCATSVVSRRPSAVPTYPAYADLLCAVNAEAPHYVVIADETARHHETLRALADAGFSGRVLVEKPLFVEPMSVPALPFAALGVGYNLRFHPAVMALRDALGQERALNVEATVGQYLPNWRQGTDYRKSYSASQARGGGVLRDLSHEIDLLIWLFGVPSDLTAIGGRISNLEIDSDDAWSALMRQPRSAMTTLHLDYLHRPGRRLLSVTCEKLTLDLDLITGTLTINGETKRFSTERNASFRAMHTAMLDPDIPCEICDAATGLAVLRTISAIERSATELGWVSP